MTAMPVPDLGPAISIGELRQNPTAMLREVRRGASYVVTDRGWPVARISPYADARWVPADEINEILAAPTNTGWAADLASVRAAEPGDDPWQTR
jgi:prevent-host-death family protein